MFRRRRVFNVVAAGALLISLFASAYWESDRIWGWYWGWYRMRGQNLVHPDVSRSFYVIPAQWGINIAWAEPAPQPRPRIAPGGWAPQLRAQHAAGLLGFVMVRNVPEFNFPNGPESMECAGYESWLTVPIWFPLGIVGLVPLLWWDRHRRNVKQERRGFAVNIR
jgi:hypothetical protein